MWREAEWRRDVDQKCSGLSKTRQADPFLCPRARWCLYSFDCQTHTPPERSRFPCRPAKLQLSVSLLLSTRWTATKTHVCRLSQSRSQSLSGRANQMCCRPFSPEKKCSKRKTRWQSRGRKGGLEGIVQINAPVFPPETDNESLIAVLAPSGTPQWLIYALLLTPQHTWPSAKRIRQNIDNNRLFMPDGGSISLWLSWRNYSREIR